MPLRKRLAWVSATAVAFAVVIAAIVCYLVVRSQLLGQVDNELSQQASLAQHDPQAFSGENAGPPSPSASAGGGAPVWQVATANGSVVLSSQSNVSLVVGSQVEAVATGSAPAYFQDGDRRGSPVPRVDDSRRSATRRISGERGAPARPTARGCEQHLAQPAPRAAACVRRRDRPRGRPGTAGGAAGALPAGRGRRDGPAHRGDRGSEQPDPSPRR